jgi:hypothetical protein
MPDRVYTRHPDLASAQVLIPDPATIFDRPVGALEQIVHLRQSTAKPIVPINRAAL